MPLQDVMVALFQMFVYYVMFYYGTYLNVLLQTVLFVKTFLVVYVEKYVMLILKYLCE